jgi:hypothetical protein
MDYFHTLRTHANVRANQISTHVHKYSQQDGNSGRFHNISRTLLSYQRKLYVVMIYGFAVMILMWGIYSRGICEGGLEECRRKWSWPICRFYPDINPGGSVKPRTPEFRYSSNWMNWVIVEWCDKKLHSIVNFKRRNPRYEIQTASVELRWG